MANDVVVSIFYTFIQYILLTLELALEKQLEFQMATLTHRSAPIMEMKWAFPSEKHDILARHLLPA